MSHRPVGKYLLFKALTLLPLSHKVCNNYSSGSTETDFIGKLPIRKDRKLPQLHENLDL